MEPLYLQSEDALYFYFKKFLKAKPTAAQLDGATALTLNAKIVVVFSYSVDGRKYKLSGDVTRKSIEKFIAITDEHGSASIALREHKIDGQDCLILATSKTGEGFVCTPYTAKNSNKLNKAA